MQWIHQSNTCMRSYLMRRLARERPPCSFGTGEGKRSGYATDDSEVSSSGNPVLEHTNTRQQRPGNFPFPVQPANNPGNGRAGPKNPVPSSQPKGKPKSKSKGKSKSRGYKQGQHLPPPDISRPVGHRQPPGHGPVKKNFLGLVVTVLM